MSTDKELFLNAFDVSRETLERLELYVSLLKKWQRQVNLISPTTIDEIWSRHIMDSYQLLPHIPNEQKNLLDIGSGGGLPGMVLAIAGVRDVHLVDSDQKKCLFLKEVARQTECDVTVHAKRIEECDLPIFDVVTSRACKSLDELFAYAINYVSHETICLFPKGRKFLKEMLDAEQHWVYSCETISSMTDSEAAILKVCHLQRGKDERAS